MKTTSLDPIYIAGQTAVGKSDVALHVAAAIGGEIVTVDSMQVYRRMDIGTAKPTKEDQARIRHHLLDVVDVNASFDAARFCELARRAEHEIRVRGKTPVFCGGTGLYFKAYLYGLGSAPPADPTVRAELESTPLSVLLEELSQKDPETFQSIDRHNARRVIRAIEVIRLTNGPLSERRTGWSRPGPIVRFFALSREPGDLRQRIEQRVERMFDHGLVDEVKCLLEEGLADNRTALQALGYRQVAEHLRGQRPLESTVELVKIRTWQFARRQLTWFRRQLRPHWIHVPPGESAIQTATRILTCLEEMDGTGSSETIGR